MSMSNFTWDKYWEIADYLETKFPETRLSNIKKIDILNMIRQIPDFTDGLNPTDGQINSLVYSWMSIRETDSDTTI